MIKLTRVADDIMSRDDGTLSLTIDQRVKGRLKVTLDDGRDAGLFLPRGLTLRHGTQLVSDCGLRITVQSAPETVSTVTAPDGHTLLRVAYHLGNRHTPLEVAPAYVRYHHDHVLDDMVTGLGGTVICETVPFEPEEGAYGGTTGGHHHAH